MLFTDKFYRDVNGVYEEVKKSVYLIPHEGSYVIVIKEGDTFQVYSRNVVSPIPDVNEEQL